jgi:predicted DNA-binding transcriptional regulator AlpA
MHAAITNNPSMRGFPMTINSLLNEKQVADLLGLSIQTLRNDRATRRKFPYIKIGKSVRYRPEDIEAVIKAGYIAASGGF